MPPPAAQNLRLPDLPAISAGEALTVLANYTLSPTISQLPCRPALGLLKGRALAFRRFVHGKGSGRIGPEWPVNRCLDRQNLREVAPVKRRCNNRKPGPGRPHLV